MKKVVETSLKIGVEFCRQLHQTIAQLSKSYLNIQLYLQKVPMMNHQKLEGKKVKNFSFLKVLGKGAWAVVYEAIDDRDGSIIAVKSIPRILMKRTPKLEELVKTEINVLKQCSQLKQKNQNIIRFVDNWTSENSIFIAMEYCNGGDLEQYLDKKNRLTQDEATNFLKQILNGFRGLHEVKAMHRDFKLANVLLHQGICKIADLGFAKQMEKQSLTKTILGTSLTMAPQLLEERPYGMQADIWSVGVVYYQLLYGRYPFIGMSDPEILKKIKNSRPDFTGIIISEDAKDFINRCLTVDPRKRITWIQIYDHPLIKKDEKMIYGLTSAIMFKDNRNFYQQGVKVDEQYMYTEKNIQKKESLTDVVIQQAQPIKAEYLAGLVQKTQQKKQIDLALKQYQKLYLNRRNNIMFIFKFVTPNIYKLTKIKANHDITLFIITKKAFHDMKQLNRFLDSKINFLKLNPYFNQFVNSSNYKQIKNKVKSDMQVIEFQMVTYRDDIESCSSEIKKQFNVEKINNSNWEAFIKETISSYEFQLAEGLDILKGTPKSDLISLIEALRYYRDHTQNAQIQQFDRKMAGINFEEAEIDIRQHMASLLQWN